LSEKARVAELDEDVEDEAEPVPVLEPEGAEDPPGDVAVEDAEEDEDVGAGAVPGGMTWNGAEEAKVWFGLLELTKLTT